VPKIQTSAEASKAEGEFASALREARARVAEYAGSVSAKKERRLINNQITVHVQQIAATRRQIEQKATDVAQFLHSIPNDPQRTFAYLSLAKRVLTQCDSQVSKLNRFAFALAEVSARVAVFAPSFGELLIALLHESCVLAVPKYYPFVEGRYASDAEYFALMGYVKSEDQSDVSLGEPPRLENTDAFCLRLRGFMLFYAAYTQVDIAKHPHGLPRAWAWCSRLLNKVPPNRFSATALEAFLKHAGFAMHAAYGRQFGKMLDVVNDFFLPELRRKDDPDVRPVVNRAATYLNERAFLKAPEGREMPVTDTSSTTRIS
jgi:nucleoporin GLE1